MKTLTMRATEARQALQERREQLEQKAREENLIWQNNIARQNLKKIGVLTEDCTLTITPDAWQEESEDQQLNCPEVVIDQVTFRIGERRVYLRRACHKCRGDVWVFVDSLATIGEVLATRYECRACHTAEIETELNEGRPEPSAPTKPAAPPTLDDVMKAISEAGEDAKAIALATLYSGIVNGNTLESELRRLNDSVTELQGR